MYNKPSVDTSPYALRYGTIPQLDAADRSRNRKIVRAFWSLVVVCGALVAVAVLTESAVVLGITVALSLLTVLGTILIVSEPTGFDQVVYMLQFDVAFYREELKDHPAFSAYASSSRLLDSVSDDVASLLNNSDHHGRVVAILEAGVSLQKNPGSAAETERIKDQILTDLGLLLEEVRVRREAEADFTNSVWGDIARSA